MIPNQGRTKSAREVGTESTLDDVGYVAVSNVTANARNGRLTTTAVSRVTAMSRDLGRTVSTLFWGTTPPCEEYRSWDYAPQQF